MDERMKLIIALQPKFREALGKLDYLRDLSIFDTPSGPVSMITPLPIDPRNPKRGLWEMLNWLNWLIDVDGDNHITLSEIGTNFKAEGDPELALLKALVHQEGVEVK